MKLPFTLRLSYYAFRAAVRASLLFFCAWLVFIPATATEQAALGVPPQTAYPFGLRQMRAAQIMVTVAPERASQIMSFVSRGTLSPFLARMLLNELASGRVSLPPQGQSTQPQPQPSDGAKFIKVE